MNKNLRCHRGQNYEKNNSVHFDGIPRPVKNTNQEDCHRIASHQLYPLIVPCHFYCIFNSTLVLPLLCMFSYWQTRVKKKASATAWCISWLWCRGNHCLYVCILCCIVFYLYLTLKCKEKSLGKGALSFLVMMHRHPLSHFLTRRPTSTLWDCIAFNLHRYCE